METAQAPQGDLDRTVERTGPAGEPTGSRRHEALIQTGIVLASELSLPAVLQKIVDLACEVTDARYGALGLLGAGGSLSDFITSGITEEERKAIGALPIGKGILGVLISDGLPVRLRRLQDHPRSVGFPANHPPMTSFLGVPVIVRGQLYGNLYLTEKQGGPEFTETDERAIVTLAAQAGVAIENARLFEEAKDRLAWEERSRLARELHDSVSQALFSMTLQVRALELALARGDEDRDALAEHVGRLRELTQGALAEMKSLIFELRPEALREEGLVVAIRKHARGLAAREGFDVEVEEPDEPVHLTGEVEEQLYRVAQEALSNVVKHASARRVRIRLRVEGGGGLLGLEICDDGRGFDPRVRLPGHLGLTTMRERAQRLGGGLHVSASPGGGTRVHVTVPLPQLDLGAKGTA